MSAARAPTLQPREVVDRYRVEGPLGQGGMATVYRVRHLQLGSVHALKLVATDSDQLAKRLLLEGRVQARLVHPNVVGVTDVIDVRGTPALILEYVAGPTLAELLAHVRALTVPQLDRLAGQILRGVEMAHGLGFAHRDLKPANVLVADTDDGPVAKVADFGLAKVLEGAGLDSTKPNVAMGTPSYMSPEQITDARAADLRSDVFSLGAILYELCCGERAFPGASVFEIFRRVGVGDYVPLDQRRPELPPRMVAAVHAALRGDRERRPATARELRREWAEEPSGERPFGDLLAPLFERHRRESEPFTPNPDLATPAPADRGTTMIPPSGSSASPTVEPGAAPRRPVWPWGAGGVAGAALVAGVAFATWPPAASPPPVPRPVPVEAPAPEAPEPPAPEARVVPSPTPAPAPSPPPTTPLPSVAAPTRAAPLPLPPPPPDPAPLPAPEPAGPPPGKGRVTVSGDALRVWLTPVAGGPRVGPGDVAPGRYTVDAVWKDEPVRAGEIEVSEGAVRAVRCASSVRVCK